MTLAAELADVSHATRGRWFYRTLTIAACLTCVAVSVAIISQVHENIRRHEAEIEDLWDGGDYDDMMPPGAMWSTVPGAGHMIADDLFNQKLRRSFKKRFGHAMGTTSVSATGGVPPVFVCPPTPKVINAQSCVTTNFTVEAVGISADDVVRLEMIGQPQVGMYFGNDSTTADNPAMLDVIWAPRPHQTGIKVVCFKATNSNGKTSQKCVRVIIHPKPAGVKCPAVPVTAPPTGQPSMAYALATIPGQTTKIDTGAAAAQQQSPPPPPPPAAAVAAAVSALPQPAAPSLAAQPAPTPPNPELKQQADEIKALQQEVDVLKKSSVARAKMALAKVPPVQGKIELTTPTSPVFLPPAPGTATPPVAPVAPPVAQPMAQPAEQQPPPLPALIVHSGAAMPVLPAAASTASGEMPDAMPVIPMPAQVMDNSGAALPVIPATAQAP